LHAIQAPKKSSQPQMPAQTPPHTIYTQSRSTQHLSMPSELQPIRGSLSALIPQLSNRPKPHLELYTAQPYTPSKSSDRSAESSTSTSPTFTDVPKLAWKPTNIRQYTHKHRKGGKRTNGHVERILRLLLQLLAR
jgi:hypothetical protein